MTTSQLTKIIKEELKNVLPDYSFKKDTGGNLYFFKEEENNFYYKLIITVFKTSGRYMITTSFALINNPLEIIYYLIKNNSSKYTVANKTTLVTYTPYEFADVYVTDEVELKKWITELKSKFNKGFTSLKESSSLTHLETTFNKSMLDNEITSFESIYEKNILKGIILAKLLDKPYYEKLVSKVYKVYEHLRSIGHSGCVDDNLIKTEEFLNNSSITDFNDIDLLKEQIK